MVPFDTTTLSSCNAALLLSFQKSLNSAKLGETSRSSLKDGSTNFSARPSRFSACGVRFGHGSAQKQERCFPLGSVVD